MQPAVLADRETFYQLDITFIGLRNGNWIEYPVAHPDRITIGGAESLLAAVDRGRGRLQRTAAFDAFAVLASTGMAVVAATHDPAVAARTDRVVRMRDGRITRQRS